MKKFFSLIVILLLCSFPILAQENSDPIDVSITATLATGCNLLITPPSADWGTLPVPVTEEERNRFEPMLGEPIIIDLSGRLPNAHVGQFIVSTAFWQCDGINVTNSSALLKLTFTESFNFPAVELMAPETGLTEIIWTSNNQTFMVHPTLVFYFMNAFTYPGIYSGILTFQVMDV